MNIIFKTFISFLIPFPQLVCNTSWKSDGILPNDRASKFESKNRDFNSIRDASKEERHFYTMLDVDKRKVINEHTKEVDISRFFLTLWSALCSLCSLFHGDWILSVVLRVYCDWKYLMSNLIQIKLFDKMPMMTNVGSKKCNAFHMTASTDTGKTVSWRSGTLASSWASGRGPFWGVVGRTRICPSSLGVLRGP